MYKNNYMYINNTERNKSNYFKYVKINHIMFI